MQACRPSPLHRFSNWCVASGPLSQRGEGQGEGVLHSTALVNAAKTVLGLVFSAALITACASPSTTASTPSDAVLTATATAFVVAPPAASPTATIADTATPALTSTATSTSTTTSTATTTATATTTLTTTPLATPTVSPTSPTATAAGRTTNSNRTVTLANDGQTIDLQPGDSFLLQLTDAWDWNVTIADQTVVSRRIGILVVRGAQGIYVAHKSGQTILTAVGDLPCRSAQPACAAPSRVFHVTVVVH